jgi:16S rRNA (cytosine967-C5)-methyltransferase
VSGADLGLAVSIAGDVLRRLPDLDQLIDSATKRPLPEDSKARMALRMALAQKIGLGTPDHAVVSTALPLVDGGPRRLVHGVLSSLLRRGLPDAESVHLPSDVEERWSQAWGDEMVEAARRQIVRRPPLDLTFKSSAAAEAFAEANGGRSLASCHVRLRDAGSVTGLPGFAGGDWWVQDLASTLPARLVGGTGREVLDLCSAPGGKAMQLAAFGHEVTAVDSAQPRLARLRQNLERTGLSLAALICADVLKWSPDRQFDSILLDASCSATGTFRRHPEVLYRARPRIIAESTELQSRLMQRAAGWLKPGGRLVYAVCSLEPEEGERAIGDFLEANSEFAIDPPRSGELPDFATPSTDGFVRILPGMLESEGGLDGFFIARLVRAQ